MKQKLSTMENKKKIELTCVYVESVTGNGYVGYIKEIPGAISQGKTRDELGSNLMDALFSLFESNRVEAEEQKKVLFDNNQSILEASLC